MRLGRAGEQQRDRAGGRKGEENEGAAMRIFCADGRSKVF